MATSPRNLARHKRLRGFLNGAAGAIAMVLGRLGDDERERVRGEIAEQLAPYRGAGGIELPAASPVVSAS